MMGRGLDYLCCGYFLFVSFTYLLVVCVPTNAKVEGQNVTTGFDWRKHGVISPVTNMGQMGKVMVVVKREELESMNAIATHKLVPLSTNQAVDCCDNMTPNFDCIRDKLGGLCSAKDYGKMKGFCPYKANCTIHGKVSGTGTVASGDEDEMLKVILKTPLLAYISASSASFQMYTSGVYSDPKCKEGSLDHVVQIVGYGTEGKDTRYWIVKNSWGSNWGMGGYIWMELGKNTCGIARKVIYPEHK